MDLSTKRASLYGFLLTLALLIAALAAIAVRHGRRRVEGPDAILERADQLAWLGNWDGAAPLYSQAETLFTQENRPAKALYARVSQLPASGESISLPVQIQHLNEYLALPAARDPEAKLRILVVLGMSETNYDAALARSTWNQVEHLARSLDHYMLASRAMGEQGIAAFMLGDTASAKREVITAWLASVVLHDPAAHVRYESVFGAGLVEMRRYQEALKPLDEAIKTAKDNPGVAYPIIAINSKIDALRSQHRYEEALGLSSQALTQIDPRERGHLYQIRVSQGQVYEDMGDRAKALSDYTDAIHDAAQLNYWRGITQAGGILARAYEHLGDFQSALKAIDQAIEANARIPQELYFVPRNLAIKAEIERKLGAQKESDALYEESAAMIDSLLRNAPTRGVERLLLSQLGEVYSNYFVSRCKRNEYNQALHILEKARGRIEAQSLEHHAYIAPHTPTPAEKQLTDLNIELLRTEDPERRAALIDDLYKTNLTLGTTVLSTQSAAHPVDLGRLQADLSDRQLLIEYVLSDPHSYALAVTHSTVHAYELPDRFTIEKEATDYRNELISKKTDLPLATTLFQELLAPIQEYRGASNLIVVTDGALQLMPFTALAHNGHYLINDVAIAAAPSATVYDIINRRWSSPPGDSLPYVGVAAWIEKTSIRNPIVRAAPGLLLSQLGPLPKSQEEIQTIATDLPKPSTLLLGGDATETHFKQLPLDRYNVLHLALHGYVDEDYPDRSALVFAPQQTSTDDGLLQIREIRELHLNASLVTLSACSTGVGPVDESGVEDLSNAFLEAGAESVVSTLWDLDDNAALRIMEVFYQNLAARKPKDESLRNAQLALSKLGLPPYYWASVELIGNGNRTL